MKLENDFFNVKLNYQNLDTFLIRKVILQSINRIVLNFNGSLLDIGCGKMPYKDHILNNSEIDKYIGLDIEDALIYDEDVKPDFLWDGKTMPFQSNTFTNAFGTEVLEHCPEPEVVLKEVYRVLKDEGVFFFTVPFLWNLHEVPNDEYRYTPFSLKRHLKNAGFENIEIKATGGWHASMAQMLGLWVKRSPIGLRKSKPLFYIIRPIMQYLIRLDDRVEVKMINGQMITGLSGIAQKISK